MAKGTTPYTLRQVHLPSRIPSGETKCNQYSWNGVKVFTKPSVALQTKLRLIQDIREPIKYIHADEREQHYRFGRVYCGYLLALLIFTLYTTVFGKRDEEQINSIFQLDLRLQINSSTLLRGGALKD
uniref:Uncharacterized protein n=1 Tax=Glossina palpalis gambiensis TaxID=67801 RepID=A0A1B0BYY2_9MUSC